MENNKKRRRSANYSPAEKTLLLKIVHQYKNIVVNMKTDAASVERKDKCWQQIAKEFNAEAPNGIFRNKESLHILFVNLIQATKKAAAKQKNDFHKIIEGTRTNKIYNELLMDIINAKNAESIKMEFDSDFSEEDVTYHNITDAGKSTMDQQSELSPPEIPQNTFTTSTVDIEENEIRESTISIEEDPLQEKDTLLNENRNLKKPKCNFSHRRPIKALARSRIAKKYEKLLDLRLQVAEIELERVKQQKIHEEQENALKLEKYKLEIICLKKNMSELK